MMKVRININMDPVQTILLRRNLNKNGNGQKFFTHEVRRNADPYVPMDTGALKNTATETANSITYIQPYARRQWYENKGKGLRGKQWIPRMWADKGTQIVNSVAKYCGGHT